MSVSSLMADLQRLGVRVEAHGDRLRYSPRSAVTPELVEQMKTHKAEVLAILRQATGTAGDDINSPPLRAREPVGATEVWQSALDRLEDNPLFPPGVMQALRAADVCWVGDNLEAGITGEDLSPKAWPVDWIDPDELTPCSSCGTLELWQSLAGDLFGRTPGRWRCIKCDPPKTARRLRARAARLKAGRIQATRTHEKSDR